MPDPRSHHFSPCIDAPEVCSVCQHDIMMHTNKPKTWGDYHREAIAAGMDDASACHAADTAVP